MAMANITDLDWTELEGIMLHHAAWKQRPNDHSIILRHLLNSMHGRVILLVNAV